MVPSDALLLLPLAVAGVVLLLRRRSRRGGPTPIVMDGSNVLQWGGDVPALETVVRVIEALKGRGMAPVVWFDANVGYLVGARYMGPAPLARALGLQEGHVFVAPKGIPADPLLLEGAARLRARVVSNDRFRDWADAHPQVRQPGFLVRGGLRDGAVWLELEAAVA